MDFILEILFDLALESDVEVASNKKMKKWVRYPLLVLLSLFIIAVIGALLAAGIIFILDNDITMKVFGGIFIVFDILLTISIIKKFRKRISQKATNEEK